MIDLTFFSDTLLREVAMASNFGAKSHSHFHFSLLHSEADWSIAMPMDD